jgi:hypothetical protein
LKLDRARQPTPISTPKPVGDRISQAHNIAVGNSNSRGEIGNDATGHFHRHQRIAKRVGFDRQREIFGTLYYVIEHTVAGLRC